MAKHFTVGPDLDESREPLSSSAPTPFHEEYLREMNRIAEIRKYPDTVLIERIKLAHEDLEAEISQVKAELEKHLENKAHGGKIRDGKNLLNKYKDKINEYNAAFIHEQNNLDEIKKIRREVADFHRQSREDVKSIEDKMAAAEDENTKKVLRSIMRKVKAHLKDLRAIETKLHDITLTRRQAAMLCTEKKRIEKVYKKLHVNDSQTKASEKLAEPVEKKPRKRKKAA